MNIVLIKKIKENRQLKKINSCMPEDILYLHYQPFSQICKKTKILQNQECEISVDICLWMV